MTTAADPFEQLVNAAREALGYVSDREDRASTELTRRNTQRRRIEACLEALTAEELPHTGHRKGSGRKLDGTPRKPATHNWSDEQRAAQAQRMRDMQERRRNGATLAPLDEPAADAAAG